MLISSGLLYSLGLVSSRVLFTSWEDATCLALVGHPSHDGGSAIKITNFMGYMFYYINQSHAPAFPIKLVKKTESDFVRSALKLA